MDLCFVHNESNDYNSINFNNLFHYRRSRRQKLPFVLVCRVIMCSYFGRVIMIYLGRDVEWYIRLVVLIVAVEVFWPSDGGG